jgi:hypothetical protein
MNTRNKLNALFLLALLSAARAHSAPIDFIFDLDSTLIFLPPRAGDTVIEAAGKNYGVAPGAGAIVQSLLQIPEARVSFFSAYPLAIRNNEALNKILLPDGSAAKDIAFKVLHGTRAIKSSKTSDPVALQPLFTLFWADIKKDLSRVSEDLDLARSILIDDTHTNALKGQEKSLLWIHNFSEDGELARARGLIEESLMKSERDGLSVNEALWQLQWKVESDTELSYQSESANASSLYTGGEKLLQSEDPEYKISKTTLKNVKQSPAIVKQPQAEALFVRKFGNP